MAFHPTANYSNANHSNTDSTQPRLRPRSRPPSLVQRPIPPAAITPAVIFGHYTLADAERWYVEGALSGRPVTIVMIRHPLDRLFSGYAQVHRLQLKQRVRTPISMGEFANRCVAAGNRMMDVGPLLEYLGVDREHAGKTSTEGDATGWAPSATAPPQQQLVRHAIATLSRPGVIPLIQEHWEESMELLNALGIKTPPPYRVSQRNRTPNDAQIELQYSTISAVRRCISTEEPVYFAAEEKFRRLYQGLTGKALQPTNGSSW